MKKYKIEAYLNDNEGGCDYSKHFQTTFIENEGIAQQVKAIPVEVIKTTGVPFVRVVSEGRTLLKLKGNMISGSKVQEFLLKELDVKITR